MFYLFILTQILLRLLDILILMHGDNCCHLIKVGLPQSRQEKHDSKKELARHSKTGLRFSWAAPVRIVQSQAAQNFAN